MGDLEQITKSSFYNSNLHPDVRNYVSYKKDDKERLISNNSSLNEVYDRIDLNKSHLNIDDLSPALESLHDGIITCIKDVNYIQETFNVKQIKIKDELKDLNEIKELAYASGLDKNKNVIKYMLEIGNLDDIKDSLEQWFAILFKREKSKVPLNPPFFMQISEINSAYKKALEINEKYQNAGKLSDVSLDQVE
jgi:hypothetical protein